MNDWCARTINSVGIHVMPLDDLVPHVARADCWCAPTEDEPNVLMHRSADGREDFEQAGLQPVSTPHFS